MTADYEVGKKLYNLGWAKKFCPECGALWIEKAIFCGYCGTKLKERK